MAENVYFMDGVDFTEATYNAYMKKIMANDGYLVGEGSELAVIQNTPAAMNVVVGTGKAWVQGVLYENTAAKTVTVDAADATYSRIDRIVVRLTWADDTVEAVYLKGTAAASPAAPTLTQSSAVWELSLARILVPVSKTSIITTDITDERNTTACGQAACRLGSMHIEADGSLDAASKQIHSLANPSSAQDADTKSARDAAISAAIASAITGIGGRFLGMTLVTATGNFTTQASTKMIRVTVYGGGGGGGGGGNGSGGTFAGGGGGAGGKAVRVFTVTGSTAYACTIGAAGTAGAAGGGTGGTGGTTSIVVGAVTLSATGGAGGVGITTGKGADGGAGGVGSNGTLNLYGEYGESGTSNTGESLAKAGSGGNSDVGAGGLGKCSATSSAVGAVAALGYASGGSGTAGITTNYQYPGGEGAPGCIIIEEFS